MLTIGSEKDVFASDCSGELLLSHDGVFRLESVSREVADALLSEGIITVDESFYGPGLPSEPGIYPFTGVVVMERVGDHCSVEIYLDRVEASRFPGGVMLPEQVRGGRTVTSSSGT